MYTTEVDKTSKACAFKSGIYYHSNPSHPYYSTVSMAKYVKKSGYFKYTVGMLKNCDIIE